MSNSQTGCILKGEIFDKDSILMDINCKNVNSNKGFHAEGIRLF